MKSAASLRDAPRWKGTSYGYAGRQDPIRQEEGTVVRKNEIDEAIARSRQYLMELQQPGQGYWVGEIEANTTLTSEYIFFMHFMETVDELRLKKMAHYLQTTQLPEGAWNIYYGGPGDLSTTVEAYAAMRLAGEDPKARHMRLAREFIRAHGGIEASRIFTKIFFALMGVYPWQQCPALPPEIMLLPRRFPMNIYEMSYWSRCTVVPLLILWHHKPSAQLPEGFHLEELNVVTSGHDPVVGNGSLGGWERFFLACDRVMKRYDQRPQPWVRKKALKIAEKWVLDHQDPTGDWGGIMPAMMNSLMSLKCLGYSLEHPAVRKGLEAVCRFAIEEGRTLRLQSCVSPVWDTTNTCLALLDSGLEPDHPTIRKGAEWLWAKQTKVRGDWIVKNPETEPGGWAFEFDNSFYPDNDDTLAVLTMLKQSGMDRERPESWHRGYQWLLSMQCRNGGWGAFDVDNDKEIWNRIPFADHKAMLDPATGDLTGRVLEFLGGLGYGRDFPPVQRAIFFVENEQESDGSWFGRWGVNYLYGTWCVLCGLRAVDYDMTTPRIRRSVCWLRSCQNGDGGWGETCASYDNPQLKGMGKSTASQTAWAIMGLVAAGEIGSGAVARGVSFLLKTQNEKGSWDEEEFTGTGFPRFFYLRYHMYRDYFPLMALGRYAEAKKSIENGF